jgi:hypothetical protein
MNKIKYIWGFLMLAVFSCTDFVDPAIPYTGFETAIYLRTITPPTSFNFFDLPAATFNLVVEAVDANGGTTVKDVQVLVRRRRGATLSPEVPLTTVPGSAFAASGKYTRTTINIPLSTALTAMGFTNADIAGGDFIEYRLILTDTQDRVFTNTNLSPDVSGGVFYASPFLYRVAVVCPSDLGGTFTYSQSGMTSGFGSCPGTITGSVTLTPVSAGATSYIVSDATFGFWNCYGDVFTGTGVRLNDACGGLSFSGTDKYGDAYTFTFISNNGTSLVFSWRNASNETGTVTLASNPGKPWPSTLK